MNITNIHPNTPPCHLCNGKCCSYFALEIDTPKSIDDFQNLKWYLLHENTFIFVEDRSWFLQINNKCQYLDKNYQCKNYDDRPTICKEYGIENNKTFCDYTTDEDTHDLEFYNVQDLTKYLKKRFPRSKF